MFKSDKQNTITSELQAKILKHICKTRDADYKTISKETAKDRITILQSLQSLMKRQYVYKQKIEPDHIKSKLIFRPTDKGMAYSIARLDVDIDDVRKVHVDADVLVEYNDLIKNITNRLQRKQFEREMIKVLLLYNLFDDKGKTIITDRKGFLKQGIRIGLFNLTANKYYNPENLFTPQVVERLKEIFNTSELKELKEFLMKIRNNLDLSIKQLSN